jgi:hypothetical protein
MHIKRHEEDGSFDETIDVEATLQHEPDADFGTTAIYSTPRYTVRYRGTQNTGSCSSSIGPVQKTFNGDGVLSVISFDLSTSPPGYSAQAGFFIPATETIVCPEGTTQRASAAVGIWWDLPPGPFQVKPDGSLAETYVDGSRTYTWSFTPDTGDE